MIFSNKSIILREQFPIIDRVTVYIHTYTGITYIGHVYNLKKKKIYANNVFTLAVNDLHEQVYHGQYSRIHAVIDDKLHCK